MVLWSFLVVVGYTHRHLSSSFLGLPYRILKYRLQEGTILRGLWVA